MSKRDRPMVSLERRIRDAESDLFAVLDAEVEERFFDLKQTDLRVRSAVAWQRGAAATSARRVAVSCGVGSVVRRTSRLPAADGRSPRARVVGSRPLGGRPLARRMFALWHAAAGSERISKVATVGVPAVALPGVRVRMPLSLLTVRGAGVAVLRSPSPRPVYRRLLAQGLGSAEVETAPDPLIEVLRLSARRPENARTIASLMRAIDRFRRPRAESVLTAEELAAIRVPTTFILGSDDPYLSPRDARPSIARIPNATVHEMPAGHGPWLVDPGRVAGLIAAHQEAAGAGNAAHLGARTVR